jgi:arylsulfatase A-like enzyme
MFEEAVKVPLIMRLPGQGEPKRIHGPVSQIDLVPTLLDLMGEDVPSHLEGESLRPEIQRGVSRKDVIVEWNGQNSGLSRGNSMPESVTEDQVEAAMKDPVRTIVTPDGWKYNRSPLGEHELYNLRQDGLETQNLASRPDLAPLMEELTEKLRNWQIRTGDSVDLGE